MELNTFSKEQNLHYIDYMFNSYKDIDGVFATDNMAILIIKECYKRGIDIPKDLKIVGYENLSKLNKLISDYLEKPTEKFIINGVKINELPDTMLTMNTIEKLVIINCDLRSLKFLPSNIKSLECSFNKSKKL